MTTTPITFPPGFKVISQDELFAKREEISSIVRTSPFVKQAEALYTEAPFMIRRRIEKIKPRKTEEVDGIIATMCKFAWPNDLEALGYVAAIEEVRASPLHIAALKVVANNSNILSHIEFDQWAYKNMKAGAYNLMISAQSYKQLEKNDEALGLHFAAQSTASRAKVLITLGATDKEMKEVIEREFRRLGFYDEKCVGSDASNSTDKILKILRISEQDIKVQHHIGITPIIRRSAPLIN
jgi:hypothetical protein